MAHVATWSNDSRHSARGGPPRPCPDGRRAPQRGAVLIMFALLTMVVLGFMGMALDLAQIYNRREELQTLAESVALAAARSLNGTQAGVSAALAQAATEAASMRYRYNNAAVDWSETAIKFAASATAPDGAWLDAASAQAAPDGLLFVKVDTSAFASTMGTVNAVFLQFLTGSMTATTYGRAIAGRSTIRVAPLAICALSAAPAAARNNGGGNVELVEFGFRRGVAYDLMQLNPNGVTPVNFVVDPIDALGTLGSAANVAPSVVGPFVCTGAMPMTRVTGAQLTVQSPFPLASLFQQLNSRFDQYPGGLCSPNSAPPDANIKSYQFAAIPWMSTARIGQSAASATTAGTKLWTVADPVPATGTATNYGPLWAYAKAVPFAAYTAGVPEPTAGYTTFASATWATLYPGNPVAISYPTQPPFMAANGVNFLAPSTANRPGSRGRRVLNLPLLSCPVATGTPTLATVLGIGKFFMTVPATATSISAEFAGVVPEQSLAGQMELSK
ncbi:TadE/TadG family type IV pilus assembly protein [Rugamonas apoptosis]|uniref:Tad domain-containing protein n=1 Tax=Rugamonas apoptosis TaxID=2758570 RepID=A0A7W2IMQ8_9BURK|nr:Tad domain-containing protein [Rugamonas apoptosis]MBA5689806.1 Tad domain-containing protein [Rugamonas apoptosis]